MIFVNENTLRNFINITLRSSFNLRAFSYLYNISKNAHSNNNNLLSGGHYVYCNFHKKYPFHNYSLGMGAIGLPGDFSSASRFVRAFFVKENSVFFDDEMTNVTQFFHIMNSVAMPKGCVQVGDAFEYTRYTSCCNVDRGIYYYNTYDNPEIKSVSMRAVDLDGKTLIFE